jgi:hypothetical protein
MGLAEVLLESLRFPQPLTSNHSSIQTLYGFSRYVHYYQQTAVGDFSPSLKGGDSLPQFSESRGTTLLTENTNRGGDHELPRTPASAEARQ